MTVDGGWTLETLKEHFQALMTQADRRNQQRFEGQEKAVSAALQAAKEAVIKAEAAAEKRFDSVNEFRQQLSDQAASFMPRREAEQRLGVLESYVNRQGGKDDSTGRFGGVVVAVISLVIAAVSVSVALFR